MLALRINLNPVAPALPAHDAIYDAPENASNSGIDSDGYGRPQRDSNPRTRDENPVSWAGLDDGDLQSSWRRAGKLLAARVACKRAAPPCPAVPERAAVNRELSDLQNLSRAIKGA
jgi:hypothetical protein